MIIMLSSVALIFIILIQQSLVITNQKTLKHISFLGKYRRTAEPGLSFKIPFLSRVDFTIDTSVLEQKVNLRLKTKDQVTFEINLHVIYKVSDDIALAYKAAYDIEDFRQQIVSIATDSSIPVANSISLEDVFDKKELITDGAKNALKEFLGKYGIEIIQVLSDEPALPREVEESANAVISSKRLNDAAKYKAEAVKTEKVGEARADGESVKIRMEEIGKARKTYAAVTGEAISILAESGVSVEAAMNFLARVGEQDALVSASRHANSTILSIPTGDKPNTATVVGLESALNRSQQGS